MRTPGYTCQTRQIWLCLVSAIVAASAPSTKDRRDFMALIGTSMQTFGTGFASDGPLQALHGGGGGGDIIEEREKSGRDSVYRPWKTRFDLQPYDLTDPKFLRPENRMSYRRFYAANPQTALAPNMQDRRAQSTVLLVFGLTALGAVLGAVLIVDQMRVLDMDELSRMSYQSKMLRVVVYAAIPWLFLGGWLLSTFVVFVAHPMRYSSNNYHWQCSAMVWFLLVAPLINALYFTVHALWISRIFFAVEKTAPMGRMFSLAKEMNGEDKLSNTLNFVTGQVVRYLLVVAEAICAVFGYMLITFRWGANSQYCQPQVYWATYGLVATGVIMIVFTALTFAFSVMIRVFSCSPWVEDFVGSFWEAERIAEWEKHDKKMAQEAAKARAAKEEAEYEEEFDEWYEEHKGYAALQEAHEEYEEAASALPPTKPKPEIKIEDDSEPETEAPSASHSMAPPVSEAPSAGSTMLKSSGGQMDSGASSQMPGPRFPPLPPPPSAPPPPPSVPPPAESQELAAERLPDLRSPAEWQEWAASRFPQSFSKDATPTPMPTASLQQAPNAVVAPPWITNLPPPAPPPWAQPPPPFQSASLRPPMVGVLPDQGKNAFRNYFGGVVDLLGETVDEDTSVRSGPQVSFAPQSAAMPVGGFPPMLPPGSLPPDAFLPLTTSAGLPGTRPMLMPSQGLGPPPGSFPPAAFSPEAGAPGMQGSRPIFMPNQGPMPRDGPVPSSVANIF